jgi:antitoxin component of MazEF toxin-antitoxin module
MPTPTVKKLTRIGDSYGVIIDTPVLDLLNITPETPLEISTDGQSVHIRPLRKRTLEEAKARMEKDIGDTLRKLAK